MSKENEVAGWKLVPMVPTTEMVRAACCLPDAFSLGDEYRAMLESAPVPPAPQAVVDPVAPAPSAAPDLMSALCTLTRWIDSLSEQSDDNAADILHAYRRGHCSEVNAAIAIAARSQQP